MNITSRTLCLTHLKILLFFITIWQFAFKVSNSAITSLLRFLHYFIIYMGKALQCDALQEMGGYFPLTLTTVHKLIALQGNDFINFVVCPKCDSVYECKDCLKVDESGQQVSKECSHVHFPNHSQVLRRKPCGTRLLKQTRTKSGYVLSPIRVFPYKSIKKSIENLVKRKGFTKSCEMWRYRKVPEGVVCDIYDGEVWKWFNSNDGNNFLSSPGCYLLTLNVDWFEPYERGVYSVGAIYLTVQNLPRNERYRPQNIIILGILPGPKEPKKTINSYLTPLVLELKEAWDKGFDVLSVEGIPVNVKLALSCVTCDIPVSRKVCDFLDHNAALACNKCLKKFEVNFRAATNYSGYNREDWILRSKEQHMNGIEKLNSEYTM